MALNNYSASVCARKACAEPSETPAQTGDTPERILDVLGLKVSAAGRPPVIVAVERYLRVLSAGVYLRSDRPKLEPTSYFDVSGVDERGDTLKWLFLSGLRIGAVLSIEVVETRLGVPPVRKARPRMNWRRFFSDMQKRDRRRLKLLLRRLRSVRGGRPFVAPRRPTGRPRISVETFLNGKLLVRMAVGHPGSLSAVAAATRRGSRRGDFSFTVHGHERLGPAVGRSYWWQGGRSLQVGDKVELRVIKPSKVHLPSNGRLTVYEPQTPEELEREIGRIRERLSSHWYSREAASMIAVTKRAAPPRRYVGGKVID